MNVQLIDKFVCHDGQSYFCRLCGRAGFKSVAAVRGHLGFCSNKGGVPFALGISSNSGAGASLRGQESPSGMVSSSFRGALRGQEAPSDMASSSFQSGQAQAVALDDGTDKRYWAMMQDISQRLDRMEKMLYNEMPHQMAVVQAQRQSFDDKWVKWVIVGYIAIWLLRRLGDDSIIRKAGNKIGDRVLGKAIDGLLDL